MSDIVSPVQNISYTNKDFVRVYEELLDLAKELSSKWDPSLSNESDPGVILLKLNAVIADKCNYNIDKSVLECFPLSVTQLPNARQLFDQLGYRMHWRRSAISTATINWIGEISYPDEDIILQPFTMITDAEGTIIYTLLGLYDGINEYNVGNMKLTCNGASSSAIKCNIIQGVPVDFTVSGNKLITIANLDENNRLYFSDTNVAENGVFISNASDNGNYNKWQRKDNLSIENFGNYYYKFDINKEGTNCYIEFPEDVENLFGEGIYIKYIRTDSDYGNINASFLSKFYDTITANLGGNNVILNTDVISITNPSSISNGSSYETINDAYRNYKRTVGTFNTLVTLRDYINAIINSGMVSNCFVCDRTNDIQTTYDVLTSINNVDQTITYIEKDTNNKELMNAFSLKLYLLNYEASTTDYEPYLRSFNMLTEDNTTVQNIKNYIDSEKCILHDYEDLLDPGNISPHVAYFRNIYPVECTIIAQTTLNNQQKAEIRSNIIDALHDNLSSKQVEFGEAITYDLIYNIISNADPRIKHVSLFNISYSTEAVYYDSTSEITYVVDPDTHNGAWYDDEFNIVNPADYNLVAVNPADGAKLTLPPVFKSDFVNGVLYDDIYYCSNTVTTDVNGIKSERLKYVPVNLRDEDNVTVVDVNPVTFYNKVGLENCYKKHLFTCTAVSGSSSTWQLNGSTVNLTEYGITITATPEVGDQFKVKLSYGHQVKYDVIAKSILVGSTPFYIKDETFDYRLNQVASPIIDNIAKVCGDVSISFTPTNNIYTLRENESLQFYAPNLVDVTSYSNYVKFEYYITQNVAANSSYQLRNNEFIIFYWTESDDEAGVLYKYHCYGDGSIITPSFNLSLKTINDKDNTIAVKNGLVQYIDGNTIESSWSRDALISFTASTEIANITSTDKILTKSKAIKIKSINEFTINRLSQYYLYWILNDVTVDSFKQNRYTLFYDGENSRMLGAGEYLIYTDAYKKNYEILGEGTLLTRNTTSNDWSVNAIDASDILLNGISGIEGNWFVLGDNDQLTVTENAFTNIGSGCTLNITAKDPVTNFYTLTYSSTPSGLVDSIDPDIWYSTYISAGTYILTYSSSSSNWSVTCNGTSDDTPITDLSTVGITLNDVSLSNGNTITINVLFSYKLTFNKDGYTLKIPENGSDAQGIQLSNFDIRYLLAGDDIESGNWVTVDNVTLNGTIGWNGRSLLSLNFGPSNPQYLLSNQSIHLVNSKNEAMNSITGGNKTYYVTKSGTIGESNITVDYDKWYERNPLSGTYTYTYYSSGSVWKDSNNNVVDLASLGISISTTPTNGKTIIITNTPPVHYPKVVMGSFDVNSYGTEYIKTITIDYNDSGEIVPEYLQIYSFEEMESIVNEVSYMSSGSVAVIFNPGDTSRTIKFNIPAGTYILPVKNNIDLPVEDGVIQGSLKVKLDGTYLQVMYANEGAAGVDYSELNEKGIHYLKMNLEDLPDSPHTLVVELSGHTLQSSVLLDNCFRYTKPNQFGKSNKIMSDAEFEKIEYLMSYLDTMHVFKYNNIVSQDKKITDPVAASSFNQVNHIYNPFTICEFSTAIIS